LTLTAADRRRIQSAARDRAEARERYLLDSVLDHDDVAVATRVLEAERARDGVRALLLGRARATGRFSTRNVLSPAEVAHAIARDDAERDALVDGLLEASLRAEDDWLALGGALVRHRHAHPDASSPAPGM
jgi:hypothetical protein